MDFEPMQVDQPIISPTETNPPPISMPPPLPSRPLTNNKRPSDFLSAVPAKRARITSSIPNTHSALTELRKLLGQDAKWRSPEQRSAIKALLSLEQDVIVALPTGVGKSVIAYLPSLLESAVTVIVIPLLSLLDDWKRRLQQLSIPFEHFEGAKAPTLQGNTNIILVTSDIVRYPHWRKAISEVQARHTIARYVFDECHYYFTDVDFRKHAMANPWELRCAFPVQFVLLSATLPQPARDYLSQQMVLVNPLTISAPTLRPELRYKLLDKDLPIGESIRVIETTIQHCTTVLEWNEDDRYLIFVNYLETGHTISEHLQLDFYHANSNSWPASDAVRQGRMDSWISGNKKGLVCTSALAAGNDYGHVRLTIHVGTPPDMVIFNQQSGRAGRDGMEAWCCILPNGKARGGKNSTGHLVGASQMTCVTTSPAEAWPKTCFRYNSSEVMDGHPIHCLQLPWPNIVCDPCSFSM